MIRHKKLRRVLRFKGDWKKRAERDSEEDGPKPNPFERPRGNPSVSKTMFCDPETAVNFSGMLIVYHAGVPIVHSSPLFR